METKAGWHNDFEARKAIGDKAEAEFQRTFLCQCGGRFVRNDVAYRSAPDFRCERCGQLVDVKSPPGKWNGVLNISERPYQNYAPDLIIAVHIGKQWKGIRRINTTAEGPFASAHGNSAHATRFYRVRGKFQPADEFFRLQNWLFPNLVKTP